MNNPLYKYYQLFRFRLIQNKLVEPIPSQLADMAKFGESPTLVAGYIKSGNTWLRFLIHNYFNFLNNTATETLTYNELNAIQHDALGDPAPFKGPREGFPYIIRTHHHYSNHFKIFDRCIYIYRNPLDTLVSAFHFHKNRKNPDFGNPAKAHLLSNIDSFVLHNLNLWELHVDSYLNENRHHITTYERLNNQPIAELRSIINYLGYPFDEKAAKASVEMSSFKTIQKMGRESKQKYGNGGVLYEGEFARKGMVGGYKEELTKSTINRASKLLKKYTFTNLTETTDL